MSSDVVEIPIFKERRTPVMLEPVFLPLLLVAFALIIGFCVILPGIRGRERAFAAIRVLILGSMGIWFIFSFFCTEWVVAESSAHVQYFPLDNMAVESKIKVQMGFSDVNITLRALDELSHPNHHWNERISYSNVDTDFDSLVRQYKPEPLLKVASYFTSQSTSMSQQRTLKLQLFFRLALAFQILALLLWGLSCAVLNKAISIGAQFLLISGLSQVIANVFISVTPNITFFLPEVPEGIRFQFGWNWSLNMGMAILSIVVAITILFMDCYATSVIREILAYAPYDDEECYECEQNGERCVKCKNDILAKDLPNKAKYETETSKAVLQIVNARKLYPKALTMRYENEEKFAKKQLRKKAVEANRESRKKAERRGSAVSISADVDQTLSYGDWKILEPGNFGSQPHFTSDGSCRSLQTLSEGSVLDNANYRTQSTISTDTASEIDLDQMV